MQEKAFVTQRLRNLARKLYVDFDFGLSGSTVFITGIGRSGTTWLSEVINYDNSYREIFEPFLSYKVKLARGFRLNQYVHPNNQNTILVKSAQKILSGRVRCGWTDHGNRRFISTKRIIKDVRTNLMLKWLCNIRPGMPIILLIRHPLSIYNSWKKLEWGVGTEFGVRDFDEVISQENLLDDFPIIRDNLKNIDRGNFFEQLIFLWCLFYYVPLKQLSIDDYRLVFYENLLLAPEKEFESIFLYLKKSFNYEEIINKVQKPSKTNYNKNNFASPPEKIIQSWKKDITAGEFLRAYEILRMFNLDGIYNDEGFPTNVPRMLTI